MVDVNRVKLIVEQMDKTSAGYDDNALKIWDMLSDDEQTSLASVINARPLLYVGHVIKDPLLKNLHDARLVTISTHNDEYGYLRPTFAGYAAFKKGTPQSPSITLPGEKKS